MMLTQLPRTLLCIAMVSIPIGNVYAFDLVSALKTAKSLYSTYKEVKSYFEPEPPSMEALLGKTRDEVVSEVNAIFAAYNKTEQQGNVDAMLTQYDLVWTSTTPLVSMRDNWLSTAYEVESGLRALIASEELPPDLAMAVAISYNLLVPIHATALELMHRPEEAAHVLQRALTTNEILLGEHCFETAPAFPCHREYAGKIFKAFNPDFDPYQAVTTDQVMPMDYFETYQAVWAFNWNVRDQLYPKDSTWFQIQNLYLSSKKDRESCLYPNSETAGLWGVHFDACVDGSGGINRQSLWQFEFERYNRITRITDASEQCLDFRFDVASVTACDEVSADRTFDILKLTPANTVAIWTGWEYEFDDWRNPALYGARHFRKYYLDKAYKSIGAFRESLWFDRIDDPALQFPPDRADYCSMHPGTCFRLWIVRQVNTDPNGGLSLLEDVEELTEEFSCRVQGSNLGCEDHVYCPEDMRLAGVVAGCNLEWGSVSDSELGRVSPGRIEVLRPSDNTDDGRCYVNDNALSLGATSIKGVDGRSGITFGCREHDKNGGDCHIRGLLYCR